MFRLLRSALGEEQKTRRHVGGVLEGTGNASLNTDDVRVLICLETATGVKLPLFDSHVVQDQVQLPSASSRNNNTAQRQRSSIKRKSSHNFDLLVQMIFGAVPLSQKGQSTKIHVLRSPATASSSTVSVSDSSPAIHTVNGPVTNSSATAASLNPPHSTLTDHSQLHSTKDCSIEQLLITKLFSVSFNDVELLLNWDETSDDCIHQHTTTSDRVDDDDNNNDSRKSQSFTHNLDSGQIHTMEDRKIQTNTDEAFLSPLTSSTQSVRPPYHHYPSHHHRRQASIPGDIKRTILEPVVDEATKAFSSSPSLVSPYSPRHTQISSDNRQKDISSLDHSTSPMHHRLSQLSTHSNISSITTTGHENRSGHINTTTTRNLELLYKQKAAAHRVTRSMFAIALIVSTPTSLSSTTTTTNTNTNNDVNGPMVDLLQQQHFRQFIFAHFDYMEKQLCKIQIVITRIVQQSVLRHLLADRQFYDHSTTTTNNTSFTNDILAATMPSTPISTSFNTTNGGIASVTTTGAIRFPVTINNTSSVVYRGDITRSHHLSFSKSSLTYNGNSNTVPNASSPLANGTTTTTTSTISSSPPPVNIQSSYSLQQDSACKLSVSQLQDFVSTFCSCPRLTYPLWISPQTSQSKYNEACVQLTTDLVTLLRQYDTLKKHHFITTVFNAVLQYQRWGSITSSTTKKEENYLYPTISSLSSFSRARIIVVGDPQIATPLLNVIAYVMHRAASMNNINKNPNPKWQPWQTAPLQRRTLSDSNNPTIVWDLNVQLCSPVTTTTTFDNELQLSTDDSPQPSLFSKCLQLIGTLSQDSSTTNSSTEKDNDITDFLLLREPYSLLGGFCAQYTPEMVLQAVPPHNFIDRLKDDLAHDLMMQHTDNEDTVQSGISTISSSSRASSDSNEAAAIIVDMYSCKCLILQLQRKSTGPSGSVTGSPEISMTMQSARPSPQVTEMVQGVRTLYDFGQSAECLQHLDNGLAQLFSRAQLLRSLFNSVINQLTDDNFSFLSNATNGGNSSEIRSRIKRGQSLPLNSTPLSSSMASSAKSLERLYTHFGGYREGTKILCDMLGCVEGDLITTMQCAINLNVE